MYVCLCHGITESDLEQAAQRSKRTEDILASLGLGQSCGICLTEAIDKLGPAKTATHHEQSTSNKREQKSAISN